MFSFFRKSRKDSDSKDSRDKKNKDFKETTPTRGKEGASYAQGSKDVCKNNIQSAAQKPEIAPESDARQLPNYSPEFGLRKNATNAPSQVDTLNEKIDSNSLSANPDIIATMCEKNASPVSALPLPISYVPTASVNMAEKRGSCVKPCGHGTVAIAPYIPVNGSKRENGGTPPASPVSEAKKPFKILQNRRELGVRNSSPAEPSKKQEPKEEKDEKDVVTASMKLHVNLPITSSEKTLVENGVGEATETYVVWTVLVILKKILNRS